MTASGVGHKPSVANKSDTGNTATDDNILEWFEAGPGLNELKRLVRTSHGEVVESLVAHRSHEFEGDLAAQYDAAWLRASRLPVPKDPLGTVRVVDLFAGSGTMIVGAAEAARALGLALDPVLAVDVDPTALAVLEANFPSIDTRRADVGDLFGLEPEEGFSDGQRCLREEIGEVDLLMGGPPCQGHSNLNNHTRREDPKNALFFAMARAAELLRPSHIIVENVRDIVHDRDDVFDRTRERLDQLGYSVDVGVARAELMGVPQRRHRMFLVASREKSVEFQEMVVPFEVVPRSFDWACADLEGQESRDGAFDTASRPTSTTRMRIDWLFENDENELPNRLRPPCHQGGDHTYLSVYGRIRPDEPAQTITTGFTYMGQGRFVHPRRPRTLTPHEAARLQFIPDRFTFGELSRGAYKSLIGNAVPPKLTYVLALQLLR